MNKMVLHKIFASILTFILLAYNIKTVTIIVNFKINQDKIAKTLCVQKDNQKGCYGKCQLVKALKKDLQTNEKAPLPNNENTVLLLNFIQPINEINFHFFYEVNSNFIYDGFVQKNILKHYEIATPPPKVC